MKINNNNNKNNNRILNRTTQSANHALNIQFFDKFEMKTVYDLVEILKVIDLVFRTFFNTFRLSPV